MKVLKPGTGQKGWATKVTCTGAGNGDGGCKAELEVDQGDLFTTTSSCRDDATFRCPECDVLTDVKGVPPQIQRSLPGIYGWHSARGLDLPLGYGA
jgi:hypothetical protein